MDPLEQIRQLLLAGLGEQEIVERLERPALVGAGAALDWLFRPEAGQAKRIALLALIALAIYSN